MAQGVLVVSPYHQQYVEELNRQAPGIFVAGCSGMEFAPSDLSPFDTALAWKMDNAYLERWHTLKWIQLVSAGADHILSLPALRSDVVVTSVRGIHANPIASYVMMMMTALPMGLNNLILNQKERRWEQWGWRDLEGKTLCQIGMGAIGLEITRRAKRSGMRVLSVSRSSKMGIDGLDSHFTVDKMDNALRYADYVVVAIPYTPKTKNLINENVIASMKPGAYFVNVARGEVIVEDDLVRALSNGHLAGAALDVFSQEPLPDDSRLWRAKNIIITPHISGLIRDYIPRACRIFVENYKNRMSGLPLKKVIDKELGY